MGTRIPPMLGKKHSAETILKMKESRRLLKEKQGYLNSTETREKISEAKKGQVAWNKGKKGRFENQNIGGLQLGHGWNKGLKLGFIPKEAFKKGQIPWNKGIKQLITSGDKNPRWKGGITLLTKQIRSCFEYRQWRSDVFYRDDFTCQECGIKGGRLHAHHINPFSSIIQYYEITTLEEALECEELWNINNGITLCKKCHKQKRR